MADDKEPKPIRLYAIADPQNMAKQGHLSENRAFEFKRAKDEPGRIEDLMRRRQCIGSYSKVNRKSKKPQHEPVVLDWKPPKPR